MNWPLPIVKPDEVGLSCEQIELMTQKMQSFVDQGTVAGLITVIARHGKIAHAQCYGKLDLANNRAMQFDDLFRMYSNTKLMCAVAVLILYERGSLQLQDAVSKYLPEFKQVFIEKNGEKVKPRREITIHDLLVHTGGLSYDLVHQAKKERWSHDEFISKFVQRPLLSEPGVRWNYSASNDVLGIVIEKISGKSLPQFMGEYLFEPLSMTDTRWYFDPTAAGRFGPVYRPNADGILKPDGELNAAGFSDEPAFFSLGGGVVSTTSDYLRFSQMLLNGGTFNGVRILSRKSVELMASDHLPLGHPDIEVNRERYGLSVEVLTDLGKTQRLGSVGEFGWGGAAGTQVWIDPKEDMISLIMMQIFGMQAPMHRIFHSMACAAVL